MNAKLYFVRELQFFALKRSLNSELSTLNSQICCPLAPSSFIITFYLIVENSILELFFVIKSQLRTLNSQFSSLGPDTCSLPTAHCSLLTAYCLLLTAYCPLLTQYHFFSDIVDNVFSVDYSCKNTIFIYNSYVISLYLIHFV